MPPTNDAFASAIVVTLDPSTHPDETVTGTNVGATMDDAGECAWGVGHTVWWKWTAPSNCRVRVDISDCDYSATAVVAAATGPDCADFPWIDDAGFDWDDMILRWSAVSGTTYYIQIDTWPAGPDGNIVLHFHAFDPTVAPSHDNVANAAVISSSAMSRDGCSATYPFDGATLESGETTIDTHSNQMHQTLWWKWVADSSGSVTFQAQLESDVFFSPRIIVYHSLDGSSSFAQFDEVGYGSTGITFPSVTAGETYYIAVGTDTGSRAGDMGLCWTFGFFEYTVGACATYVSHTANGDNTLFATYPSINGGADPSSIKSDGYIPINWSAHVPGQLLLAVVATTEDGAIATPSGWSSATVEQWGDAPYSTGVNPGFTPYYRDHANIGVFWRIADGTEGATGTEAFRITGITYKENGDPPLSVGGGQMFTFDCYEMGNFTHVDFPSPPVVYAGMNSVDPELLDDPSDRTTAHVVTVPAATADAIGNHQYIQIVQIHGYDWFISTPEDGEPDYPDSRLISPTGADDMSGGHAFRYDGSQFAVFTSPETFFTNSPDMTDIYSPGSVAIYPDDSWNDGFIGVVHVNFEDWTVLNGIAALALVVQAPESTYQPNDTSATAYTIPTCPAVINECNFNTHDDPDPHDLWFKFTPAASETVTIHTTDSDFDTELSLYDAGLTFISTDDDSGPGTTSLLTLAVTAGETYYIQVSGHDSNDYGNMRLTLDCTGGLEPAAFADIWGWGGETGEGWHIALGVPS